MSGLADDIKVGFKETENVPAAFGPRKCFWFSFLLEDHSAAGRMSMKNSGETIGNRTRDPPACSKVPQPTALPRAP
jgi:hypothetical protein